MEFYQNQYPKQIFAIVAYHKQHQTHNEMVLTFDLFYVQPNINMAIQRVLNEIQEYKYIQFMQFNYLQVMNINCKKLFVYSYCYPVFPYAYIITCKILYFSATVELMHFELSGVKNICLNQQEFSNYSLLTSFYMKRTLVVKKYDA